MKRRFVIRTNSDVQWRSIPLKRLLDTYKAAHEINVEFKSWDGKYLAWEYGCCNPPLVICMEGNTKIAVMRFIGSFDWQSLVRFFEVFNK